MPVIHYHQKDKTFCELLFSQNMSYTTHAVLVSMSEAQMIDPVPTERRLLHKNGSSFYPGDVQILTGHTRNMERK